MSLSAGSRSLVAIGLAACALLLASEALAKPKSRQIETEAIFQSFDPEAGTMTVKVLKPGKSVRGMKKLKKGKEAVFKVKAEGSVLTRTTVKLLSGRAAKFTDLREGKKVKIFWIPDEEEEGARFARSVSMFKPPEEVGEDAEMD